MNAAARVLSEIMMITSAPTRMKYYRMSYAMMVVFILIASILASGLGLITCADNNRVAIGALASLEKKHDELHTVYNQLLLEKNMWITPARIANIAEKDLHMMAPDLKKIVMLTS